MSSLRVGLLKAGVTDSEAAIAAVAEIESHSDQAISGAELSRALAGVADPDLALTSLA